MIQFIKNLLKQTPYIKEYLRRRDITADFDKQQARIKVEEDAFRQEFLQFIETNTVQPRFDIAWEERHPCLYDKTANMGFDRHYVYHLAWATRVLQQTQPKRHTDISSLIHFSAMISAFMQVDYYDYRKPNITLPGLIAGQADLLHLPFADGSIASLSCMHTVEHIGLGRYGDPLDYDGDIKAINELQRVLAQGGNLLFVVPVGTPKIYFNAHRVYSMEQIITSFASLTLKEFTLIKEYEGGLIPNATAEDVQQEKYGCGCFWFTKT
jgi:SAM-dependent methyltransferase